MSLRVLQEGVNEEMNDSDPRDKPPKDFDLAKFNRGRKFYMDNLFLHTLAMFCSLVVGLNVTNLLDALVFTNKSETSQKSLKRYKDTFRHVFNWHYGDMWHKDDRLAYESITKVRKMHKNVRRQIMKAKGDRVYFSQYDMSLVQSGFMGVVVMYPDVFCFRHTQDDFDAYVYFWYVIGYLLGIDDKYNICAGGYGPAYNMCKQIEIDVVLSGIRNPPPNANMMAKALIDGTNTFLKMNMFTVDAVTGGSLYHIDQSIWDNLSIADKLRCCFVKLLLLSCYYFPPLLRLMNSYIIRLVTEKNK